MGNRESAADYDADMQSAKAAGIDAFALNIATDPYTDTQLDFAYESAAKNNMKVFISFDYNYFQTSENALVGAKLAQYCGKPGQLLVDGKCFVSTFNGDNDPSKLFNAKDVRAAAGTDLYLVPNLSPTGIRDLTSVGDIDGAFNWIGWDSNGANRAPTPESNITTSDFDAKYTEWLGGKTYMAPVSPWFFTNFASKAWNFPGDLLWFRRWNEILALAPQMIEIITWNDYGESHYVGPDAETSKHSDDGSSAWVTGKPHGGWLEMAEPYIAAYKAGAKEVSVSEEKLVYWYRGSPKAACGSFDGIDTLQDAVFVVALLKTPGTVSISSGANTQTFDAPAGASAFQLDMGVGKQTFSLTRDGAPVLSSTGALEISNACSPVNLNPFVGVAKGTASVPSPPVESPSQPADATQVVTTLSASPTAPPSTSTLPLSSIDWSTVPMFPVITPPIPLPPTNSTTAPLESINWSTVPMFSVITPLPVASSTPPAVPVPIGTGYPIVERCTRMVTAREEVRPTNCVGRGVWWGGEGDMNRCDGVGMCV